MLTVLQVIPELETGGAERTTVDVAAAIAAAGGRALVASRGGRLEGELAAAGGELHRLALHAKDPWRLMMNAIRLAAIARAEEVDIIHARSRAPAWSALWAARATGRAFVTTYHGTYKGGSALKRFYNSVMARGDVVIANSNFIAQHVRRTHATPESRLAVIPRGSDMAALDPAAVTPERVEALRLVWGISADERRPIALLPGRLTRWKGQALAIEALALLKAEDGAAPALLVMVGDDQGRTGYRGELEALIAARGLSREAVLAGHCADMPAAFALSDVVLSPALEPEAFGRVAVEAQAMGRPVIVADHGGARETVVSGEGGLLAAPGDAGALAAALARVLAMSPQERLAMGARGSQRVRRLFTVEAMTAATLAAYARALERRAA